MRIMPLQISYQARSHTDNAHELYHTEYLNLKLVVGRSGRRRGLPQNPYSSS